MAHAKKLSANGRPLGLDGTSEEDIRIKYPDFSRLLIQRKNEIMDRHDHARAQLDQQVMESPGDEADLSVIDTSADYFLKLANTHQRELMEIHDAFERMHRGAYGLCLHCEEPIAMNRLEKLPYARYCINCQTARERGVSIAFPHTHPKL